MSISPSARDISVSFKDSCNCCKRPVTEDTQVYIRSDGIAVRFDPKKAQDEIDTLKRSIIHLNARLSEIAERSVKDTNTVKLEIMSKFEDLLDPETPTRLTLGNIDRINSTVREFLDS